jgi:hypothetical protein
VARNLQRGATYGQNQGNRGGMRTARGTAQPLLVGFKTCKMKGFIRAKGLDELQHAEADSRSSPTSSALWRFVLLRWMRTRA